jgi:Coenzyme PQQ synthesis protein D (PqqD)
MDSVTRTQPESTTPELRPGAGRIARAPSVIAVAVRGYSELVNTDTGQRMALSETTDRLWQLLGDVPTLPALVERLRLEYAVHAVEVAQDVASTLAAWRRARLIVWQ